MNTDAQFLDELQAAVAPETITASGKTDGIVFTLSGGRTFKVKRVDVRKLTTAEARAEFIASALNG
jgi:hypothetical protein